LSDADAAGVAPGPDRSGNVVVDDDDPGRAPSCRLVLDQRPQGGTRNNDLWDCLDDRSDDDTLSDGCIRIGTHNDLDAEWTGGFFDPTGHHF